MSTAKEIHALNAAALKADADWHAELTAVYGKNAGDARYDNRGAATPKLAELKAAKRAADDAWMKYLQGTRILKTEAPAPAPQKLVDAATRAVLNRWGVDEEADPQAFYTAQEAVEIVMATARVPGLIESLKYVSTAYAARLSAAGFDATAIATGKVGRAFELLTELGAGNAE